LVPRSSRIPPRRSAPRRSAPPRKPVAPSSLEIATEQDHDLESEATFKALGFYNLQMPEREADSVEFVQCRFRSSNFSGSVLNQSTIRDCLVQTCDWANMRSEGATWTRVELNGSRMTGLTISDSSVHDVLFEDCRLDLSAWRFTYFDAVQFSNCNLSGADFTNADLRGAHFVGCDLTRAQFHQATMDGARFRNCVLAGIGSVTAWKGAIVHHTDLMALSYALAGALGIQIDSDD
jgi:uncharacterized protein YjbI with pentapeptide repeats